MSLLVKNGWAVLFVADELESKLTLRSCPKNHCFADDLGAKQTVGPVLSDLDSDVAIKPAPITAFVFVNLGNKVRNPIVGGGILG